MLQRLMLIVLLLSFHAVSMSQQVGRVDFGPCFSQGCQVASFVPASLSVHVTDSSIGVNDGRSSSFRLDARVLITRSGCLVGRTYSATDRDSRPCVVTLVEDGCHADNRVVVSYPGTITVYHLRIFIARPCP
jgi:hypothetical protein